MELLAKRVHLCHKNDGRLQSMASRFGRGYRIQKFSERFIAEKSKSNSFQLFCLFLHQMRCNFPKGIKYLAQIFPRHNKGTPGFLSITKVEVPASHCFRYSTFISADSENMRNISADQLCFRADEL